ncbi:hypothetical protein [Mesonia aestuariivivens]|uniref:Uncharacterized protein n=1 Tax=Mesonia aestuariivivens TaxID=2796128 RepID=A0ABS6W2I5_9FLAO|nr:hypothetical protein [Mesonia aestuariivivens]MBW2962063.1 hypothetical protein [Mesonia aestuariivivens]
MSVYQKCYGEFKEMYYGSASIGIIASSCLGAIAAMLILMTDHGVWQMLQLFLVVMISMGYNTAVLSCLPSKQVFNALVGSVSVNLLFILYYGIMMMI